MQHLDPNDIVTPHDIHREHGFWCISALVFLITIPVGAFLLALLFILIFEMGILIDRRRKQKAVKSNLEFRAKVLRQFRGRDDSYHFEVQFDVEGRQVSSSEGVSQLTFYSVLPWDEIAIRFSAGDTPRWVPLLEDDQRENGRKRLNFLKKEEDERDRRSKRTISLARITAFLTMLNFIVFSIVCLRFGGSAMTGKIENGIYFLGQHGVYTQVSAEAYGWSRIHEFSVIAMFGLTFLSVLFSKPTREPI